LTALLQGQRALAETRHEREYDHSARAESGPGAGEDFVGQYGGGGDSTLSSPARFGMARNGVGSTPRPLTQDALERARPLDPAATARRGSHLSLPHDECGPAGDRRRGRYVLSPRDQNGWNPLRVRRSIALSGVGRVKNARDIHETCGRIPLPGLRTNISAGPLAGLVRVRVGPRIAYMPVGAGSSPAHRTQGRCLCLPVHALAVRSV
jgi:hypothetical protein